MYKIIKDGASIGLTENLNYIKKAENGCYVLCPEPEAMGIVFGGTVYHLLGRDALDGVETIGLEVVDGGNEITKTAEIGGIMFVTLAEAGSIDDVTAGEHINIFESWVYPKSYTQGQIRSYSGKLYRCIQAHTSRSDWTPDIATSLWICTADPSEEWPEWSQPVGAEDAYAKDDKVSHSGKHWTSDIDNNVWEPGVYGWTEASDAV